MARLPQSQLGRACGYAFLFLASVAYAFATAPAAEATTPPALTILAPGKTAHVSGTFSLRTRLSGRVRSHSLSYFVDGAPAGTLRTRKTTVARRFDSRKLANGAHTIVVRALVKGKRRTRTLSASQRIVVANSSGGNGVTQLSNRIDLYVDGTGQNFVSLKWNANGMGLSGATYEVLRDGKNVASTKQTAFQASGLSCATTYGFALNADDSAGNRIASASIDVRTAQCPDVTPPNPATNVTAAPVGGNAMSLTWTAATDDVGVTEYAVLVDGAKQAATAATSFSIKNLECEHDYQFTIDARDLAGNHATAPPVKATTGSCPAPSGEPMPMADLANWKEIFAENFRVDAATGTMGSETEPTKIIYTGARGTPWVTYPSNYYDTYNHRPYRSDQVLSVHDGVLDFHLHNVDGQPAGANPSPVLPGSTQYQTYGRYSARMKVDATDLSEYYVAWLLWPQNQDDWESAESDFPEQSLVPGNQGVTGVFHFGPAQSDVKQQEVFTDGRFDVHEWHTYTQEWLPDVRRYYVDGELVHTTTHPVYSGPERWQLQTETNGDGTHDGHLLIDWAVVYSYAP